MKLSLEITEQGRWKKVSSDKKSSLDIKTENRNTKEWRAKEKTEKNRVW